MDRMDFLQLQSNRDDPDTSPSSISILENKKMGDGVSIEGAELATTLPKMTRKLGEGSSNRSCLCSPTAHPGSFRCRLHRKVGVLPKRPWKPMEVDASKKYPKCFNSSNAIHLSRLGRSALAESRNPGDKEDLHEQGFM